MAPLSSDLEHNKTITTGFRPCFCFHGEIKKCFEVVPFPPSRVNRRQGGGVDSIDKHDRVTPSGENDRDVRALAYTHVPSAMDHTQMHEGCWSHMKPRTGNPDCCRADAWLNAVRTRQESRGGRSTTSSHARAKSTIFDFPIPGRNGCAYACLGGISPGIGKSKPSIWSGRYFYLISVQRCFL